MKLRRLVYETSGQVRMHALDARENQRGNRKILSQKKVTVLMGLLVVIISSYICFPSRTIASLRLSSDPSCSWYLISKSNNFIRWCSPFLHHAKQGCLKSAFTAKFFGSLTTQISAFDLFVVCFSVLYSWFLEFKRVLRVNKIRI